ncbi:MAG: mandelate racemase/muconate lactonizing enzyme family protein [Bryobacteraceae bacterium]
MWTRRQLLRTVLALPFAPWMARYKAIAAPYEGEVKITAVKVLKLDYQFDGVLVKIETDAGLTGWGETGSSLEMARSHIAYILDRAGLIGADPLAIERHFYRMMSQQHPFMPNVPTISGIDIALWDLAGKITGQPVYKLLGGPFRDAVPMYSHGDQLKDMHDPAACRAWAQYIREQPEGFTTYKINIHQAFPVDRPFHNTVTSAEMRRLTRAFTNVREAVGDETDIAVHCHGEFDTPSGIAIAKATESMAPLFLEDALNVKYSDGWLALKRSTRIPILTGEKLETVEEFRPFLDNQAADIIHPDISFAGGFTGCRKIADFAFYTRTPVALHNLGTLVRTYASAHLAMSIQNFYRSESRLGRPGRVIEGMDANGAPVVRNGLLQVRKGPGLGLVMNEDYLRKHQE